MGELDVQPAQTDDQQQKGHHRDAQGLHEPLGERELGLHEAGARSAQLGGRAVEQPHLPAVQELHQLVAIVGQQVDQAHFQGDPLLVSLRGEDRLLAGLDVAPPPVGDGADHRRQILVHFLEQDRVFLDLSGEVDPRGRPGSRARSHRGDVGGDEDEETRRGRPRAGRADPDHHRHLGRQHTLDDLLHGRDETARGVELDQHQVVAEGLRVVDGVGDPLGGDRVDHRAEIDETDHRLALGGGGGSGEQHEANDGKTPHQRQYSPHPFRRKRCSSARATLCGTRSSTEPPSAATSRTKRLETYE